MSGEVWPRLAQEVSAPFTHPFVQNPLFAKALGAISHVMSFETSGAWLLFLSGMAVVVLVAASYHLWFRSTMPWGIAALVTACVLALPTTLNSFWIGQTTPLIVAGVAYGLAASRTRPWLAGIVLGVVASIKLTPYALIAVMLFSLIDGAQPSGRWPPRRCWWSGCLSALICRLFRTGLTESTTLVRRSWSVVRISRWRRL